MSSELRSRDDADRKAAARPDAMTMTEARRGRCGSADPKPTRTGSAAASTEKGITRSWVAALTVLSDRLFGVREQKRFEHLLCA